jgi:hypothetical protein
LKKTDRVLRIRKEESVPVPEISGQHPALPILLLPVGISSGFSQLFSTEVIAGKGLLFASNLAATIATVVEIVVASIEGIRIEAGSVARLQL